MIWFCRKDYNTTELQKLCCPHKAQMNHCDRATILLISIPAHAILKLRCPSLIIAILIANGTQLSLDSSVLTIRHLIRGSPR